MSNLHVDATDPWVNVVDSRHFLDWLGEQMISLSLTINQTCKLYFVGRPTGPAMSVLNGSLTIAPGCGTA